MHRTLAPISLLTLASLAILAGCASLPSAGPVKIRDGVLVDLAGRSLYTYDRDTQMNDSQCESGCIANWPPLPADPDVVPVGNWYPIKRSDGLWQWTYKGKPIYFHVKDRQPGDKLGDDFNGVWHLARP